MLVQIIANADFSEFELQVGIISKSILMELKESNAVLQCAVQQFFDF